MDFNTLSVRVGIVLAVILAIVFVFVVIQWAKVRK